MSYSKKSFPFFTTNDRQPYLSKGIIIFTFITLTRAHIRST